MDFKGNSASSHGKISISLISEEIRDFFFKLYNDSYEVTLKDTETLDMTQTEMFVTGFKAKLKKDTSYKGLWTVSFGLEEL